MDLWIFTLFLMWLWNCWELSHFRNANGRVKWDQLFQVGTQVRFSSSITPGGGKRDWTLVQCKAGSEGDESHQLAHPPLSLLTPWSSTHSSVSCSMSLHWALLPSACEKVTREFSLSLQLTCTEISVADPEYMLPRSGDSQPWLLPSRRWWRQQTEMKTPT